MTNNSPEKHSDPMPLTDEQRITLMALEMKATELLPALEMLPSKAPGLKALRDHQEGRRVMHERHLLDLCAALLMEPIKVKRHAPAGKGPSAAPRP